MDPTTIIIKRLYCTWYDLWCVYLHKSLLDECIPEELTDAGFYSIDRLIRLRAKIQDPIIQSGVKIHSR